MTETKEGMSDLEFNDGRMHILLEILKDIAYNGKRVNGEGIFVVAITHKGFVQITKAKINKEQRKDVAKLLRNVLRQLEGTAQ